MTITLNLTENDAYIAEYIAKNNIDTSNMSLTDLFELLEDIEDTKAADQAYLEYLADPTTLTTDELLESLGLTREDIA